MTHRLPRVVPSLVLALIAVGCDGASDTHDAGAVDTGAIVDAGGETDSGEGDAGNIDGGAGADSGGGADAGTGTDSGTGTDAGTGADAGAGTDAGGATDAGAGTDAGGPTDAGPLTCTAGTEAVIGQFCVTSAATAGGDVTFQVVPSGCRSSSCTIRHTTRCDVTRSGGTFDLSALFCLEPTGGPICTGDCNGGGFANCSSSGVEAGTYTAVLGGLSVTFTVPSTIPPGGICDGSPF